VRRFFSFLMLFINQRCADLDGFASEQVIKKHEEAGVFTVA
jgi:hypothetical protein